MENLIESLTKADYFMTLPLLAIIFYFIFIWPFVYRFNHGFWNDHDPKSEGELGEIAYILSGLYMMIAGIVIIFYAAYGLLYGVCFIWDTVYEFINGN